MSAAAATLHYLATRPPAPPRHGFFATKGGGWTLLVGAVAIAGAIFGASQVSQALAVLFGIYTFTAAGIAFAAPQFKTNLVTHTKMTTQGHVLAFEIMTALAMGVTAIIREYRKNNGVSKPAASGARPGGFGGFGGGRKNAPAPGAARIPSGE